MNIVEEMDVGLTWWIRGWGGFWAEQSTLAKVRDGNQPVTYGRGMWPAWWVVDLHPSERGANFNIRRKLWSPSNTTKEFDSKIRWLCSVAPNKVQSPFNNLADQSGRDQG